MAVLPDSSGVLTPRLLLRRFHPWEACARLLPLIGLLTLAAVAAYLGRVVAQGQMTKAAGIAVLPGLIVLFWALAAVKRSILVFAALGLNLVPISGLSQPLTLPGDPTLADVIVGLALVCWILERLVGRAHAPLPRSPVLRWPLALFALSLVPGLIEGYDRYDANLIGQPVRLILYAAIVLAMTNLRVAEAYRGIVIVFYVGTVVQALAALYYMASGGSQTDSYLLSTGGTRVLALSTAMYLAGALVLALLNLHFEPSRWLLHVSIATLALFGVVVAYGRTTYVAVAVLLPILFLSLRNMRRVAAFALPVIIPMFCLVAIMLPSVAPDLVPTLMERVNPDVSNDTAVLWRERAVGATLNSSERNTVSGAGFGGTSSFSVASTSFQVTGDPHNSFIYLYAGGGVLALGSFCLLLLLYLIDAGKKFLHSRGQARALVAWSVAFWFVLLTNTMTGPILTQSTLLLAFWTTMLLPSIFTARQSEKPAAAGSDGFALDGDEPGGKPFA